MKIKLRRNRHNLSHYKLGTGQPGELLPVGCVEVLPGDTFNHRVSSLIRFLPMNAPIMHRVQMRIHHFFVPTRILWSGFEDFITRQEGADPLPSIDVDSIAAESDAIRLASLLGLSMENVLGTGTLVSKMPFVAYNMIYNEWYRDQDLVTPLVQDAATLDESDMVVQKCAWQKDYFTAARPWPQKGPDITLPLGTSAPVEFQVVDPSQPLWRSSEVGTDFGNVALDGSGPPSHVITGDQVSATNVAYDPDGTLFADLSSATAVTVDAVRRAFSLQRLAERLAQFGSRYPELLASMGVKSSDARLQRPEYLGGGKVPISFTEVLQTAEGTTTPVGEMRGHGISPGTTRPYRRFFEEHGYVLSLLSIRPQAVYSTVNPRHWWHGLVDGANDFYTPELERIGQQEIYGRELFMVGNDSDTGDSEVFGYNDRYAEYRHQPSQVSGEFSVSSALDYWTWARGFDTRPQLNQVFTDCAPDDRIFAASVGDNVMFLVNHHLIAQRMLTNNVIGRIL